MAHAPTDAPERLVERVQELQDQLDATGDSTARELADELVSAIVQMYGAGLERIVERLFAAGTDGERIAVGLTEDPLVATLLLIHDLHPVPLEDRVHAALESVRPYMESHGGGVEFLSLEDGVARIHLRGSCSDCSASSVTLELAIKQALEEAAPDLAGLEVEGVAPQMTGLALPMTDGVAPTGLELPILMSGPGSEPPAGNGSSVSAMPPSWFELESVGDLPEGAMIALTVADSDLVIANVEGTLLAYRDVCASCGGALHDGELLAGALACPSCRRSFFLPRAGRSIDAERIQLEPVPLLREQGRVKVALAAAG
jgi:Fe-S cluster biogenesis protein NfuA/nitrite reductase/ring-hydroxylating ferredoxin subunit